MRSARPDATIPAILREQFEKDDGSPLKSVPVDLDGDGKDEKFVLCGVPTAAGAYQWLVYDPVRDVGQGVVVGAIIFVGREIRRRLSPARDLLEAGRRHVRRLPLHLRQGPLRPRPGPGP
ncbi:MAG: hypothetical protein M0C28_20290 [Candidatus Moduliflexus flocculans]|nr:hypothetical protein [Candidatus Moduliflexus flocculans]